MAKPRNGRRGLSPNRSKAVRGVLRGLAAHPVVSGTAAAVAGGLIVFALTGPEAEPTASSPADAGPSCEPAIRSEGLNESLPPGVEPPEPTSTGSYSGQIAQGDVFRVSKEPEGDFVDAVTVRPGQVVTVGLRLTNPGPGEVGDVRAHVTLPDTAASALKLEVTLSWDGVSGYGEATDTATIFVSPSKSKACARYIPQSTVERLGQGQRTPVPTDWITAKGGVYVGQVESGLGNERFLFFDVVVI